MRKPSRLFFLAIAAVGFVVIVPTASCATHGEGERCETNNNNDDCDNGLICTPGGQITIVTEAGVNNSSADICCPPDRSQATTDICKLNPLSPGSDASLPDTGVPDATSSDSGGGDAASDAGSGDATTGDAASDAGGGDAASDAASE